MLVLFEENAELQVGNEIVRDSIRSSLRNAIGRRGHIAGGEQREAVVGEDIGELAD